MKVEIVVPAINLWHRYTKQCLDSLLNAMIRSKTHGIDCHILLIDNASVDETKDEAPKMVNELFEYHRNEEHWGFQKSVNFGVTQGLARGADFILICNNDILLHPEAITKLVERFDKGDVGMVSCLDVRGEMKEAGQVPTIIGSLLTQDKESVDEAPHPNFSAFMINRACWEVVGEMDEVFAPAYFEDNDYHYRMKLLEMPAIVLPTAMFYHYGSRTQNEAEIVPLVSGGMFENNRASYVRKWGGLPGHEEYKNPYNNIEKSVRATQQNPSV